MKKNIILTLSLLMSLGVYAQMYRTYPASEASAANDGMFYALPQSEILVKVKVEKTTRTKGIYSDKAYLLGLDNAELNREVSYKILDLSIDTRAIANDGQRYFLSCSGKTRVDISENGILRSITASDIELKNTSKMVEPCYKPEGEKVKYTESVEAVKTFEADLIEQGLMNSYPLMSAEKVVAEIKSLRQKQIDILSGSLEGTYLNTTVDYMYKQLDEIIKGYLVLFTGVSSTSIEEYTFNLVPEKPIIAQEDLILPVFKFSKENGVSDLSSKNEDMKVVCRIHSFNTTDQSANLIAKQTSSKEFHTKAAKRGIGFYYVIPEQVKLSLEMQGSVLQSKMTKLCQYGTIGVMQEGNNNVVFDQENGSIQKIWK